MYTLTITDNTLKLSSDNTVLSYVGYELDVKAIKRFLNDISTSQYLDQGIYIEYKCSSFTKIDFKRALREMYLYERNNVMRRLDPQSDLYKALLQQDIHEAGFITIMRNNEIIVIDKIAK